MNPPSLEQEIAQISSRLQVRTLGQGHAIADINDTDERLLEEATDDLQALYRRHLSAVIARVEALPSMQDRPLEPTPDAQDLTPEQRKKWREWSIVENRTVAELRGELAEMKADLGL